VAEYTVNLKLAVRGSKDLDKLNKRIEKTRKILDRSSIGSDKFKKSIGELIKNEKTYEKALITRTRAIDNALRAQTGMQTLEQREHQLLARGNKLRDLRLRKEKALNQQRVIRKGLGGAVGSGIIGGGFPLLFGQGPTAAIGGALGGMGQFGFALSIAGTTIGSALDELTKALAKPTENIETLVTKLGLANTETGDLVLRMNELGMTSDASALLLNKFAEEFGLTQEQIKENTEKMNDFNNEINLLGTSLTLLVSDVLGPLIEELNNLIQNKKPQGTSRNLLGIADFFTANAFDLDKRGGLIDEFFDPTGTKFRNPFNRANDPLKFNTNPLNLSSDDFDSRGKKAQLRFEEKELLPLKQALELEQKRLTTSTENLNVLKQKFELENLNNELKFLESQRTNEVNQQLEDKISKLKIVRDTQEQIVNNAKALADPFRQLSNIIAQDIGNGIKGLIKGTETLNNVLKNVLNKLADAALNMAIFGNVGGQFERGGGGILGSIFRAEGGPVKRGGSFIVGERGPELFTPGASGMITPNHALGGSTNVVVNVDASGSNVEGDEQGGRELGRLISAAVQSEIVQQQRPGGLLA